MVRLHVVVEGQTEEAFVRNVLCPYMGRYDVIMVARCVETSRKGGIKRRGGIRGYSKLRRDLMRWMKEDANPEARFSTMIDLYSLPADFPGYEESRRIPELFRRVEYLETCFSEDVDDRRFVPYLQLHEFEALLFADASKFVFAFPDRQGTVDQISAIRSSFPSPEHIDDGENTAPSKRIREVFPDYDKVAFGPVIAAKIGIETLVRECSHFAAWIDRLKVPVRP